jgi:signal transduction histidine kinase
MVRYPPEFEAVLAERARLARELHDTLLQRFTGITLQIDGVRNALHQQSNPLANDLSRILDQADQILRESREMVWMAEGR